MPVRVAALSLADLRAATADRAPRSFLQTPGWAAAKPAWEPRPLGWFTADGSLVGTGLALLRRLPYTGRGLAYLPEGPDLDWEGLAAAGTTAEHLAPMVSLLRATGAFAVRIGPQVRARSWTAPTVKRALAARAADPDAPGTLGGVRPDAVSQAAAAVTADLAAAGWRPPPSGRGFGTGQPRHTFRVPLTGRSEDELWSGLNQLWRRSVRAADKAGVRVTRVVAPAPGVAPATELAAFHALYTETAARDGFTPRPASYFTRMWSGLAGDDPDRIRLHLARVPESGALAAATLSVQVGRHAWYSYGASSTALRDTRASQALQWRLLRDAHAEGCTEYDLRGITDTLDPDDPHVGLLRFKVGTGGEAVETVGEWDLPLNRLLHRGLTAYLDRRG